jgi:hypothetical protein
MSSSRRYAARVLAGDGCTPLAVVGSRRTGTKMTTVPPQPPAAPPLQSPPIQWTDVTGWTTLWAPDDGPAITAAVLSQIEDGQAKGATLLASNYGFTDASIATAMGSFGAANPANRYLFDSSEYFDPTEQPLVNNLISQLQADQWAIGTAPDGSDILHSKIAALLYPNGTGWTFSGSFNLSSSAQLEFNIVDFIWSRSRAEAFAQQIQAKLTWCRNNQPQPPTQKPTW